MHNARPSSLHAWLFLAVFCCFASTLAAQENIQPSLMVFPSDNLLYRLKCFKKVAFEGDTTIVYDYEQAFRENTELNFIISGIQKAFSEKQFPVEDLQAALRKIKSRKIDKQLERTNNSIKNQLLMAARPDIILEIEYAMKKEGMSTTFTFNLRAIDSYTLNVVAVAVNPGTDSYGKTAQQLTAEQLEKNMTNFTQELNAHFTKIREDNGREIIVRFETKGEGWESLRREKCGTVPYQRWFKTWLDNHVSIKTVKALPPSDDELNYEQVKIPLKDADGIPVTASDWLYPIIEDIQAQCGLEAYDNSQGLGEGVIIIIKD